MDNYTTEKTYDSVFWTGVVRLTRHLVPLVNEVFGVWRALFGSDENPAGPDEAGDASAGSLSEGDRDGCNSGVQGYRQCTYKVLSL